MNPPDKHTLVAAILEKLRGDFEARQAASKATRSVGNDTESRAENKYDTLSIEQNYLADGLAKQAHAAAQAAAAYDTLELRAFSADDPIDIGALVEVRFGREREWFFLGPAAGGIEIQIEGFAITVITPESPLGSRLLDRKAGDTLTSPNACIHSVA